MSGAFQPHEIEVESFRRLRKVLDLSGMGVLSAAVLERIVHATADPSLVGDVVVQEGALAKAVAALGSNCDIVTDVEMTRAGLAVPLRQRARCYLGEVVDPGPFGTRSAAAMHRAALAHPEGLFVIGCAPTALFTLLELAAGGEVAPVFIVGMPVGFVGATESKEALARSGMECIYNRSMRGGSAMAAAAVNALHRNIPTNQGQTNQGQISS